MIGWWLSLALTEFLTLLPALRLPALESADVTGFITAVRGFSAGEGTLQGSVLGSLTPLS